MLTASVYRIPRPYNAARRLSTTDGFTSRIIDIKTNNDWSLPKIIQTIRTGPLESIKKLQHDPQQKVLRVSFLHRSSAIQFINSLGPNNTNVRARYAGPSTPLSAGIVSAVLLRGATRCLRIFAWDPNHTNGIEDRVKKFGAMEKYPTFTGPRNSAPFLTCDYFNVRYAMNAYARLSHPPKDPMIRYARFAQDHCDHQNVYSLPIPEVPAGDSRVNQPIPDPTEPTDTERMLGRRTVVLHHLPLGTTREELEGYFRDVGLVQSVDVNEDGKGIIVFISPSTAHSFCQDLSTHTIKNNTSFFAQLIDSPPLSQRLSYSIQLGATRTVRLTLPGEEPLVPFLKKRFGKMKKDLGDCLTSLLRRDLERFGTVNEMVVKDNSVYVTYADIYRASRLVHYFAWPADHPTKLVNLKPYRGLVATYVQPSHQTYRYERFDLNPDGVEAVKIGNGIISDSKKEYRETQDLEEIFDGLKELAEERV